MSNDDNVVNDSRMMKWMPTIVLFSVVTGFVMLSWYAYNVGKQSVKEDDLLVIEAEKTPMKEKPLDPGGMKFPNQDKTIFETFSSNQQPAKVERVLPASEEPVAKNEALEAIAEKKSGKQIISFNDENEVDKESQPTEVQKIEAVGVNDKKAEIVKAIDSKISGTKIVEAKPLEKMVEKTTEKAIEKPVVKSGGAKIQLGAFGSEKEANENWQKFQNKYSVLSDKSPVIVRAEVKGKIFYRLRVVGFNDISDAKSTCKTLSAKGQACMHVAE